MVSQEIKKHKLFDTVREIKQYLLAQQAKGLLENVMVKDLRYDGYRIDYEAHWNTHKEVIAPEVRRIAKNHGRGVRIIGGVGTSKGRRWFVTASPIPKPSAHVDAELYVRR